MAVTLPIMTLIKSNRKIDEDLLLKQFNSRNNSSIENMYLMYSRELNSYAASLFGVRNHDTEDIVEDAFIGLWSSKNKFSSIISLKAYLYVSVKNSFFRSIEHGKHVKKYEEYIEKDSNFMIDVMEVEIYSLIAESQKLLPTLYADVIRMHLEGWSFAEIASSLGKTEQNIYNIKNDAVKILRKKLSRDKLLLLLFLIR